MNKTLLIVVTVIALSIAAYFILHRFLGLTQQKALWITAGAGTAMILFDVVLVKFIRKR